MLYWVGKKPLEYVKGFPARLTEVFDPQNTGLSHEPPVFKNLDKDWQNLLFHGDNKEVLATLLENGFRGKVDLIYIDPPFGSDANYVRKVELRSVRGKKLEGEDYTLGEQTMYFDIWKNDAYLQWMYERLQLLKEVLSNQGAIFLHTDWRYTHQLRCLMDEIFGAENFRNDIVVRRIQKNFIEGETIKSLNIAFDTILLYSKSDEFRMYPARTDQRKSRDEVWHSFDAPNWSGGRENLWYELFGHFPPAGNVWRWTKNRADKAVKEEKLRPNPVTGKPEYLIEANGGQMVNNFWWDIIAYDFDTGYPTEKSEKLLNRILQIASAVFENPIILDSFCGSGTAMACAERLGFRWIGCDINKGAVQTTSKRLQKIISDQIKEKGKAPAYSFGVYQVNDYDLKLLHTEAIELAIEHIGIERRKTDSFFDGTLGRELVKIIDFNHPLTLLDLQLLEDEIKKRPDEERNIVLVCLGKELAADPWIEEWNKKHPVNKIRVIELRTDKKYGKFLLYQPVMAKVKIERKGNKAIIDVLDFNSPTIIERLNDPQSVFKVKIPDFRAMIDVALIDTAYDGKTFRIVHSDVPEKKSDYIIGHYELEIPKKKTTIALKIIDMLGEEVIITKEI